MIYHDLPRGIVGVLQTPFQTGGAIDYEGVDRLVESAIEADAHGLVAPAVASEVDFLDDAERAELVRRILAAAAGRIGLIVGASAASADKSALYGQFAARCGATAYLVCAPSDLDRTPERVVNHFQTIAASVPLPLIIQDLDWTGPGLSLETIAQLRAAIPRFAGLKIETVPAGPKYSAVKQRFGEDFYVAGGWAVMQMIEALDRGVDALMPECSMLPVYVRIDQLYRDGRRDAALDLFRRLLPVLAYTNQEIRTSIAFFKQLLVRRGIFGTPLLRGEEFAWDGQNRRIAEELIELYVKLESSL